MTEQDGWHPEPHPVAPELADDYRAEPYADPWNSIMERLNTADRAKLRQLAAGGTGDVNWSHTEIGTE